MAVNITWCVAVRGIGDDGARAVSEPPLAFVTTLRVTHSVFAWFGDPLGESSIYRHPSQTASKLCSVQIIAKILSVHNTSSLETKIGYFHPSSFFFWAKEKT